jgi:hypothetical protein
MRTLLIAGLIVTLAPQVRAQDALPHFVFNGHRIGEPEAVVAASGRCKTLDTATRMCLKQGEEVASMRVDVSYSYRNQGLASLHVKVDSGSAFEPLLTAFTKQYGTPRALRRGKGVGYAQWRFKEGRMDLTRTGTLVIAEFRALSSHHPAD